MKDLCFNGPKKEERKTKEKTGLNAGAIFGIVLLLVFVIGIAAWCVYAYRYPTSKSGLFFIEVKFYFIMLVTNNSLLHHFQGQGILPYMVHIGRRGPIGYGFSALLVINRASILVMHEK